MYTSNGSLKKWTMEINNTTIYIYYTNRLFGFAPYALKRNKQNVIVNIERNNFFTIYSVALVISLACLTNFGLYMDAESAQPIRWDEK